MTQPASRKLLLDHLNTFPSREFKHSPNEFIDIGHIFNGIDGRSELCILCRLAFNKVKIRPKENLEYHGFPIYPSTTISTQARIRVFEQKREGFNGPSDLTPSYYVWSQILLDSEDETRARRVDFPIILTDIERSSRLRPNKKHQQQLQEAFIAKNSMALVTSHATKEIFVCHVIQINEKSLFQNIQGILSVRQRSGILSGPELPHRGSAPANAGGTSIRCIGQGTKSI